MEEQQQQQHHHQDDDTYAYSVYQLVCRSNTFAPPSIDRQPDRTSMSRGESEHSERVGSPYPASPSPSDYCQSAAGEHYAGSSSQDYDGDLNAEVDLEADEDLSSDPPPQRSDSVSAHLKGASSLYKLTEILSSQEWDRIGEEIREMETGVVGMSQYEIVDKLGEGEKSKEEAK